MTFCNINALFTSDRSPERCCHRSPLRLRRDLPEGWEWWFRRGFIEKQEIQLRLGEEAGAQNEEKNLFQLCALRRGLG